MNKKIRKVPPRDHKAHFKVLGFFFDYPTKEFSLNDLCANLNISKTTANRVVQNLRRARFLNIEHIGKIWRVSCNQKHPYNITRKIPYHLSLVLESGILAEIHKIIPNPRAVILFGSYRKGDDIAKSDIDIAVEILGDKEMKIVELGVISQLGYRENVKVNVHIFTRKKINHNLFANIANGIVLEGFLEV